MKKAFIAIFGLASICSAVIPSIVINDLVLSVSPSNTAILNLQLQKTDGLTYGNWENVGEPVRWEVPMTGTEYFRVQASGDETMKTYTPDNTTNLLRAVLWQYDRAEKLKALISSQQDFFQGSVTDFWNEWRSNIFNLATADSLGLAVWGKIIGIQRPKYTVPTIEEIGYWRGIQAYIGGDWENGFIEAGSNYPICTRISSGKPVFENTNKDAGNYTLIFETDRWIYYRETTAIYQQTSVNDWYWEGSWEAVSPETGTPSTPSPICGTTGLSYWDEISPKISGAGTTQVNGNLHFLALFFGIPAFYLDDPDFGNLFLDIDGKWTIWKDTGSGYESKYKATTVTDWPWEAEFEVTGGSYPSPSVSNFSYFSDDSYRKLLQSRLMMTRMTGSMKDINAYMAFLFSGKAITVTDNLDMTITYTFFYTPTDTENALIAIDGVLPRPAGVEAIIAFATGSEVFGLAGQRLGQLDLSSFAPES